MDILALLPEVNLLAEAIGIIGMILLPVALQFKDKKVLLMFTVGGCIAWSAHFYLLGEIAGSVILAIAAFRYTAAMFTTNKIVAGFFIAIAVGSLWFTYTVWYSIIPVIAAVIITLVIFQDDMKIMRKVFVLEASLWFAFSVLSGSYSGTLTDTFILGSAILGYLRHERPEVIIAIKAKAKAIYARVA